MKLLPNILIVDDSRDYLALIKAVIGKIKVNLIEAFSGDEALEKTHGVDLALAIIDIRMPGMSGIELAKKLNQESPVVKVPIIFLTGNSFSESQVLEGYGYGAIDYLKKTVDNHILLCKINLLLDLYQQKQEIIEKSVSSNKIAAELAIANEANRKSEEKYRNYIDHAPDGVFVADITGKIIEVNDAACRITGYQKDELLKLVMPDIVPEESIEGLRVQIRKVIGTNDPKVDVLIKHKNGSNRWLAVEVVKIAESQFLCFAKDITDTRKAEELLQQARHNYKTFINTMNDFLFVLDQEGNIIYTNNAVFNRLGYTREELFGKPIRMIHPSDRQTEVESTIAEMFRGTREFCLIPVVTKSGICIPVETRISQGIWDDKPVLFGVSKDISQLRLSEEKFSKLFFINPSACGLSGLDSHKYIEVNNAFYDLLGFESNEVIGKTPVELGILTYEALHGLKWKTRADEPIANIEADLRAKNGDIKHVLLSADIILIQDIKYRFTVVQDLTAVKQAEQELKSSIDQLHQLTQYAEQVREDERVAISRDLHDDLGQALTAIKIDMGIIRQNVSDKEIVSSMNRVTDLVGETIKTVQRITSQLRPQIIDDLGLEAAIEWYTNDFAQRIGIEVYHDMDPAISIPSYASIIIFRIMQESLTNIARHSCATRVDIGLSKTGESVQFRISDNGIGISEDQIQAKRSFGIIGMKERAVSLGGTFVIYRREEGGTAIQVIFPLIK